MRSLLSAAAGLIAVFEETAACPRVAGHITGLLDGEQEHIGVTVVANSFHNLEMAAGGTFVPELLTRAAPVMGLTARQCGLDRLTVHPGHHQHGPVQPVLRNGWDQPRFVKTELIDEGGTQGLHQALGHTGADPIFPQRPPTSQRD